jgi:hypothetical protein
MFLIFASTKELNQSVDFHPQWFHTFQDSKNTISYVLCNRLQIRPFLNLWQPTILTGSKKMLS